MSLQLRVMMDIRDCRVKRDSLLAYADQIHTVALGSSHGDLAFVPSHAPGGFNLCTTSQDLYHSAQLYEYAARHCPKLRHVVLFYSPFSPGFNLLKSSERFRSAVVSKVFGTKAHSDHPEFLSVETMLRDLVIEDRALAAPHFGRIYSNQTYTSLETVTTVDKRVSDHGKHNRRGGEELHLLRMIVNAHKVGHSVSVVIPPMRHDYKTRLLAQIPAPFETLYYIRDHFDFAGKFQILNFLQETDFADSLFADFDHLWPDDMGAAWVTRQILARLQD